MKNWFSRRICMMMLCFTMILKTYSTALWVGQSYVCDAATAVVGLTSSVSWSCTGGYINMTGSGFARTVTATQYWSGTAQVTCTWKYRLTANSTWQSQSKTWTFTCQENPVHITPTEMVLSVGQTASVGYYHEYSNSYTSYASTYFSCSGNVVSVTRDGTVTALNPGTAYINVYSNISNAANAPYCTVTVKNSAPQSVSIDSPIEIEADMSRNLYASVYPSNASVSSTEWSIQEGSECISLTPSGYLTGIKPGTARIYCMVNNSIVSNTAIVIVSEPPFYQKSSVPLTNTTGVSAFVTPSVTFSSSLFEGDNFSTISLKNSDTGKMVSGTATINGSTLKFTPTNPLAEQTNYIFTIPANAVKNKWGTHYSSDITITFKTGDWEKLTLTSNIETGIIPVGSMVTLTANSETAKIYYNINSKRDPTNQDILYTTPITVNEDISIKAIAIANYYHNSDVLTRYYEVSSLAPETIADESINSKTIPSVVFNERITEGKEFNSITLIKNGLPVSGEILISGKSLCFVPQEELKTGTYTLFVPAYAVEGTNGMPNKELNRKFILPQKMEYKPMVAVGGGHYLAIKSDGSLWTWGRNDVGQLGDNTFTDKSNDNPVKVLENVVYVAAGSSHSLAIKSDGSLWAWGNNHNHQLGDGTDSNRKRPVNVMNNVSTITAKENFTYALKKDGSFWVWGDGLNGQLGRGGRFIYQNDPYKLLDNVVSIASGIKHGLAVKKDGTLWAWGYNSAGQVGNGTTKNQNTPVQVATNMESVAAGNTHSMAIDKSGCVWSWGSGYNGQLGNGGNSSVYTPVKACISDVSFITGGFGHSLAVKKDNSMWSWGWNYSGQLCNGNKNGTNYPMKVFDEIIGVSAYDNTSYVIKADTSLWKWGDDITNGKRIMSLKAIDESSIMNNISLPETFTLLCNSKSIVLVLFEPVTAEYESMSWTSSNEVVATVTDRGIVTGIAPGETTLTVTVTSTQGNVFTGVCAVTVTDKGDDITGKHSIFVNPSEAPFYNLGGQRVKKPMKKGIYVRSGKKEVKR